MCVEVAKVCVVNVVIRVWIGRGGGAKQGGRVRPLQRLGHAAKREPIPWFDSSCVNGTP